MANADQVNIVSASLDNVREIADVPHQAQQLLVRKNI